jgi:hypothetical protein
VSSLSRLRLPLAAATIALGIALAGCGSGPGPGIPSIAGASSQNPCQIIVDFGEVAIGLTSSATVEVMNNGGRALDLSAESGGLDPEFGVNASSLSAIQPGNSGTLGLTFQPYKIGQVQSTLTIETDGFNPACPSSGTSRSTLTVQLTGNGVQPSLVAQPNVIDFGDTIINNTATRTVTLVNDSPAPVDGIVANIVGSDADLFTLSNVPTSLAGYTSAEVDVSYTPTALETRSIASVVFSGADGEKAIVNLFGEPLGVAITVAPNPINFGYVAPGMNVLACVTVTGQSNLPFVISEVDFSIPDGPFGLSTPVPITIPAGGSAKVCFSYTGSTDPPPSETATLVIQGSTGTNPVVML